MKKNVIIAAAIVLLLFKINFAAHAKVWRVNNASNYNGVALWGDNLGGTQTNPVFEQINQAVAANFVLAGDTLHIEGATAVYENAALSKRLVLIGPGYFLSENPNSSNILLEAKTGSINFQVGSSGSELIGIYVASSSGITILKGAFKIVVPL
jgi:hypothetical protein